MREDFFAWVWRDFARLGLLGVHEGTFLSVDDADATLDSAQAPSDRDWVEDQDSVTAEFYFETKKQAEGARISIESATGLSPGGVRELKSEDWDAQWKASFLAQPDGLFVPPFWRVLPPWTDVSEVARKFSQERILRINPGAGFGTGTHETTQLCMGAIAEEFISQRMKDPGRALDFGSGSGILSIAAALLGAEVDGVEIDPLAIDNALDNARLNGMEGRIHFAQELAPVGRHYELVIANILKPVLLEYAPELLSRLALGGTLILSGLLEKDVAPVLERYSELGAPRVLSLGEWRAIILYK